MDHRVSHFKGLMIGQIWEYPMGHFETIVRMTHKWVYTAYTPNKLIREHRYTMDVVQAQKTLGYRKLVFQPKLVHYFQHDRLHIQIVGDHGFVIGEIKPLFMIFDSGTLQEAFHIDIVDK